MKKNTIINDNVSAKVNAVKAVNSQVNVKKTNGLFCSGYPVRFVLASIFIAISAFCIVNSLLSGSLLLAAYFTAVCSLWYFVGLKKCYPVTLFFVNIAVTLIISFVLFTFFFYMIVGYAEAIRSGNY